MAAAPSWRVVSLCALMLFICSSMVARVETVLRFDDLPAFTKVGEHYAALGVNFSLTDFRVQTGLANGNQGNWGLNGTNGPYFVGFNGFPSYSMTVLFDMPIFNLSLDVSRANGSQAGDRFTLSTFNGATLLDTQTITLAPINTWTTVSSPSGDINKITWSGAGGNFYPFGVDNLRFSSAPEPGSMTLLGVGVLGLFGKLRRHTQTA